MKISKTVLSFLILISLCSYSSHVNPRKAKKIHEAVLTVDTHLDSPLNLLRPGFDIGKRHEANEARLDIPKMQEGGLDVAFWAAFTSQKARTPENSTFSYKKAHQIIDSIYAVAETYGNKIVVGLKSSDAVDIVDRKKKAIYIGMENGFPIDTDINRVEEFYKRGVRYITLVHTSNNDICDSSTDEPEHNGLSEFGYVVIKEMNRLGIMIDISHASDETFYDVLKSSKAPIIASHSSVRALCNHPRNLSDDMIKALAENGGVIQICILSAYIAPEDTTTQNYILKEELRVKYNDFNFKNDAERKQCWNEWREINKNYPATLATVKQAVDHIEHVINLVGIDYVGIGSDFDGGARLSDCLDVSEFPNITAELLNRGYSKKDIAQIWGGNFLRVFSEVERLAEN